MTKEQMDAIWNAPGVRNAGHLNLWSRDWRGDWHAKEGARRVPAWDKALLKRARRDLPKWHEGFKKGYRT
jgi:hypothetical protein